jgi:hypothetical protein
MGDGGGAVVAAVFFFDPDSFRLMSNFAASATFFETFASATLFEAVTFAASAAFFAADSFAAPVNFFERAILSTRN